MGALGEDLVHHPKVELSNDAHATLGEPTP